MPSQIRYFWWLSIAIVLFWVAIDIFGTLSGLDAINKLPDSFRDTMRRIHIIHGIIAILIWGGVVLLSAWLVAFRRTGWARYLFVAVILADISMPILVALSYYGFDLPWLWLAPRTWLDPENYVTLVLLIAAVFFAFSGPAQRWFQGKNS